MHAVYVTKGQKQMQLLNNNKEGGFKVFMCIPKILCRIRASPHYSWSACERWRISTRAGHMDG